MFRIDNEDMPEGNLGGWYRLAADDTTSGSGASDRIGINGNKCGQFVYLDPKIEIEDIGQDTRGDNPLPIRSRLT